MAPKLYVRAKDKVKKFFGSGSGSSSAPKTTKDKGDPLNLDDVSREVFGEEEHEEMETSPLREDPQREPKGKEVVEEESEEEEEEEWEEDSGSEGEDEDAEEEEEEEVDEESGSESGSDYEEEVRREPTGATGGEESEEEEEGAEPMQVELDVVETTTRAAKKSKTVEEELAVSEPRFLESIVKSRYERIKKKKVENSWCLDPRVLKQLGIEADFYKLTDRAGITRAFWKIDEPSYTRLVVEFLCTMQLTYIKNPGEWKMAWKFQGFGTRRPRGRLPIISA